MLKHGVGGLNIDGCRVEAADADALAKNWDRLQSDAQSDIATALSPKEQIHLGAYNKAAQGRFPANLVLSHSPHCTDEQCDIECAIKMLDEQADSKVSRFFKLRGLENTKAGDTFFYCAKISSSERNAGLEDMPDKVKLTQMRGSNGTALKPAAEFWILIRKPISEKNVAANVLKHGVGGLNIDACRIASSEPNPSIARRLSKPRVAVSANGWENHGSDDAYKAPHPGRLS